MRRLAHHAVLLGGAAAAVAGPVTGAGAAARQGAVPVCQATGDGAYVLVQVLPNRLTEYRANPANLVPAPGGGCPDRVTATTPAASPSPMPAPAASAPAGAPAPARGATGASGASGPQGTYDSGATTTTTQPRTTRAPSPAPQVAGVSSRGSLAAAPRLRSTPFTGRLPVRLTRLPVTGSETWLLLLLGADLLVLGAGLRLRTRPARP